jgi:hypothetical protein
MAKLAKPTVIVPVEQQSTRGVAMTHDCIGTREEWLDYQDDVRNLIDKSYPSPAVAALNIDIFRRTTKVPDKAYAIVYQNKRGVDQPYFISIADDFPDMREVLGFIKNVILIASMDRALAATD